MKLTVINKAPRLALSGIKTFTGMEGQGLNADLYFDGKKVAFVLDEGCGGEMLFQWNDGRSHNSAISKQVNEYIASLNLPVEKIGLRGENDSERIDIEQDLESLVNNTVDDIADQKRMARMAKTSVLYRLPEQAKDAFYALKHKGQPDACKAHILKKHPNAIFLA